MTNLLIGYPDVPVLSTITLSTGTIETGLSVYNMVTGARGYHFRLSAATASALDITFDRGASATDTAAYVAVMRADLLQKQSVATLALKAAAAAPGTANTIYNNGSFSSATLYGPRSEDFITTFAESSAYRYWALSMTASAATKYPFSKVYFGNLFDMTREPYRAVPAQREFSELTERDGRMVLRCEWRGITDAKRSSFIDTIAKQKDVNPVFLYDAADRVLAGYRFLHCYVRDVQITPTTKSNNTVAVTFEEVI